MARNTHQIRQLERRLAQNSAAMRYYEADNTKKEQALFAIADYESMKSEWDQSKKKFEASVQRAQRYCAVGEGTAAAATSRADGDRDEEKAGDAQSELIVDEDGGMDHVEATTEDRNQAPQQPVIPSIEDRFVMVQSLANDQVYCTKIVTRLDTVCALTKSAAFTKLRDSFAALEAELVKTNDECAALISLMPSSIVPMKSDFGVKHTYPEMYGGDADAPGIGEGTRGARQHWRNKILARYPEEDDRQYWADEDGGDQEEPSEDVPWYERDVGVDVDAIEPTVDNLELRANLLLRQRMWDAARAARRKDEPEERIMREYLESGECAQEEGVVEEYSGKKAPAEMDGSYLQDAEAPEVPESVPAEDFKVADTAEADGDLGASTAVAKHDVMTGGTARTPWEELEGMQCEGIFYQDDQAPEEPTAAGKSDDIIETARQDLPGAELGADLHSSEAAVDEVEEVARTLHDVVTSVESAADSGESRLLDAEVPEERAQTDESAVVNEEIVAPLQNVHVAPDADADLEAEEMPAAPAPPVLDVAPPPNPVPPLVVPGPGHGREQNNQFVSLLNILGGFAFVTLFVILALMLPALLGEVFYSHTAVGRSLAQRVQARVLESVESEEMFLSMAKLLEYLEFSAEVVEVDADRTRTALAVSENIAAVLKVVFGYSFFLTLAVSVFAASYLQFLGGLDYGAAALPDIDIVGAVSRNIRAAGEMFHSTVKFGMLVSAFGIATPIALTALTAKVLNRSLPPYLRTGDLESLSLVLIGALFIFSYLITLHVWQITKELRRAIDRKYLVGILPEADDMDDARAAHGENTFISFHEKLKKLSYSQIVKRILIRTSIMLPAFVVCVMVPIRIGHLLCPLAGPLMFRLKQVTAEMQIPVEMMLSHIFIPLIIEKMKYKAVVKFLVSTFLGAVAPPLGLGWILAPAPENRDAAAAAARNIPPGLVEILHPVGDVAGEVDLGSPIPEGTPNAQTETPAAPAAAPPPRGSALSVLILVLAGLALLAVISSWVLHAPLAAGRWAMLALRMPTHNDLFNYPVGLLICWGACFVVHYIAQDIARNAGVRSALAATAKWVLLAVKVLTVGTLWLGLPPMILGILLETLFVAPMRLTVIETPFFPFLQNWALGLIILKAFSK
jgi:hypothetical protein